MLGEMYMESFFKNVEHKISKYNEGNIVFVENEVCTSFNLILKGAVQIQKISPSGNVLVVAEFKAGDSIGESLIFGSKNTFPMSGIAKLDTTILPESRETILYLCQKDIDILTKGLQFLSDTSLTLSEKLDQVTLKTIRQRICEFILDDYNKHGNLEIKLNMSKTEWADKMGVQRPSLARELRNLREEGLIDVDRNYIYVKDLEKIIKAAI